MIFKKASESLLPPGLWVSLWPRSPSPSSRPPLHRRNLPRWMKSWKPTAGGRNGTHNRRRRSGGSGCVVPMAGGGVGGTGRDGTGWAQPPPGTCPRGGAHRVWRRRMSSPAPGPEQPGLFLESEQSVVLSGCPSPPTSTVLLPGGDGRLLESLLQEWEEGSGSGAPFSCESSKPHPLLVASSPGGCRGACAEPLLQLFLSPCALRTPCAAFLILLLPPSPRGAWGDLPGSLTTAQGRLRAQDWPSFTQRAPRLGGDLNSACPAEGQHSRPTVPAAVLGRCSTGMEGEWNRGMRAPASSAVCLVNCPTAIGAP